MVAVVLRCVRSFGGLLEASLLIDRHTAIVPAGEAIERVSRFVADERRCG